jgi:hypothetical protein
MLWVPTAGTENAYVTYELRGSSASASRTGTQLSLLLKVRVPNTAGLLELVERLRQIRGIEQSETTVVLKAQFGRPIPAPQPSALSRRKGHR